MTRALGIRIDAIAECLINFIASVKTKTMNSLAAALKLS